LIKDYYKILGVDKGASTEEIRKAFRSLSKKHHPDHGGDEDKFKEINEAHLVLSDPQKREDYDNPMRHVSGNGFPFGDIFGMRRSRPDPNAPRRGRHIQLEYDAPLHIFILGGDVKVSLTFDDVCVECGGKGAPETDSCNNCGGSGMVTSTQSGQGVHIQSSGPCPACHGKGQIPKGKCDICHGLGSVKAEKEVILPIKSGTRDGQVVGAAGEGVHGVNGGPPGDLIVKLRMTLPKSSDLTDEQKEVLKEL
jgi:molecular chaperone DnaJ